MHQCFVVGDPIAHSRSPAIHVQLLLQALAFEADFHKNQNLKNNNKNIENIKNIEDSEAIKNYITPFQYAQKHIDSLLTSDNINDKVKDSESFENFVNIFFEKNNKLDLNLNLGLGLGLNVTLPFKFRAYQIAQHAQKTSIEAHLAEAANTLGFDYKLQQITAHNTDGLGLVKDLTLKNYDLYNKTILIIGAGGATFGVLYSLLQQKPKQILIMNRSYDKALNLLNQYKNNLAKHLQKNTESDLENDSEKNIEIHLFKFDADIEQELKNINSNINSNININLNIDFIINATSLGIGLNNKNNDNDKDNDKNNKNIEDNSTNQIDQLIKSIEKLMQPETIIYEMAYGMPNSTFKNLAAKYNLKYHDGKGMLINQAKASFLHWQKNYHHDCIENKIQNDTNSNSEKFFTELEAFIWQLQINI